MVRRDRSASDDGSDIVALARKVGLAGFGRSAEVGQTVPAMPRSSSNDDDGSDIVALARKVGIHGFGRFADTDAGHQRPNS